MILYVRAKRGRNNLHLVYRKIFSNATKMLHLGLSNLYNNEREDLYLLHKQIIRSYAYDSLFVNIL
jgi:hypothetical protein